MIALNLIVPKDDRYEIEGKVSETFRIITSVGALGEDRHLRFFVIETTEEEATFLSLKYGIHNVWKR